MSHTVVVAGSLSFQAVAFSQFSDSAHDVRDVFFVMFSFSLDRHLTRAHTSKGVLTMKRKETYSFVMVAE